MISGLNASNSLFVTTLYNLQTQLSTTEEQLSSGLSVNQASDAPQVLGDIFQSRSNLASVNQETKNYTSMQAVVNAGDSSVQTAIQLMQNALTIGSQAANTNTDPSTLPGLANQVQSLLSQMVSLTQTQVNGVYIFSGDDPSQAPYQLNSANPTGVQQLVTASATQQISDPNGVTFPVSLTAQQIFDAKDNMGNPTSQNVFLALNNLQLALKSGNTANITTALDGITSASSYLNQQLAFYGTAENRITSAINLAQKFQVQDQTQLGNLQDANVAQLAVQLQQETTDVNAAMAAQAKRPRSTLFDYLPNA